MTTRQYHPTEISISASGSYANPYTDIVAHATFTKGTTSITVPMFYTSGVKWNARFSPPTSGTWNYSIVSVPYDAGLDKSNIVIVPANNNANVHGRLRLSTNGKHFVHEDGAKFFYHGIEADWLWAMDNMDAGTLPNTKAFIDTIKAHGFTSVCIQAYAHAVPWNTGNGSSPQSLFDYGPPPKIPWQGTYGAEDTLRMNNAYWAHFDKMMDYLHSEGIVVHIMLKAYNKAVNWPANLSAADDLWFNYIVARYQGYSNVVWDVAKECFNLDGSDGGVYHRNRVDLIRAQDNHDLLVTLHDPAANDYHSIHQNDNYVDFRSDQIQFWQYDMSLWSWQNYPRAYVAIEYGYEQSIEDPAYPGVDFGQWNYGRPPWGESQTWDDKLKRTWRIAMGGGYCNYYYVLTSWDMLKWEPNPPGFDAQLVFSSFWRSLPFQDIEPHPELLVPELPVNEIQNVYCRAKPGEYYVFFCQTDGFSFTANIQGVTGTLSGTWIDGATGNVLSTLPAISNGQQQFTAPTTPSPKIPILLLSPTVSGITDEETIGASLAVLDTNESTVLADVSVSENVAIGGIYPSGLQDVLANQAIPNLPIRAALLNGYTFNVAHTLISDVSGSEIAVSGYSRKDLTGLQVVRVNENIYYKANTLQWASLGGAVYPQGVVLFFAGSGKLLSYHPLIRSKTTDGSPFDIKWPDDGFIVFGEDAVETANQNFPQVASGFLGAGQGFSIGAAWWMNNYHGKAVFWRPDYGKTLIPQAKLNKPDNLYIATSDRFLPPPDTFDPSYAQWFLKDGNGEYVALDPSYPYTHQFNATTDYGVALPDPDLLDSVRVDKYMARQRVNEAAPDVYPWSGWEHDWFNDAAPFGEQWDYNRDGSADGAAGVAYMQEDRRNYLEALIAEWASRTVGQPPLIGYNSGSLQTAKIADDILSFRITEGVHFESPTWNLYKGVFEYQLGNLGGYQPMGSVLIMSMDGSQGWSEWNMTPLSVLTNLDAEPLTTFAGGAFVNYDPLRKANLVARQNHFSQARYYTSFSCMGDAWIGYTYGYGYKADWYYDEYHADLGAPLAVAYRLGKGPRPTNPLPLPDLSSSDQPTPSTDQSRLYGSVLIRFFERGAAICYLPRNDWMTTVEVTEADLQTAAAALGLTWAGPYYKFLGLQAPVAVYVDDGMSTASNDGFGCTLTGAWTASTGSHWNISQDLAAWGGQARFKDAGAGTGTARWTFEVPVADTYDVYITMPHKGNTPDLWVSDGGAGRQADGYLNQIFNFAAAGLTGPFASNAHYTIQHDNGSGTPTTSTATADLSADKRGQKLGTFKFLPGVTYYVELDDGNGADGPLIADGLYLESVSALYNDGSQFSAIRFFGGVSSRGAIAPTGSNTKDITGDGILLKAEVDFISPVGLISSTFPVNGTYPGISEAEFFGTWTNVADLSHYPNQVVNDNPYWCQLANGIESESIDKWGYKEASPSASNYYIHRIKLRKAGLYNVYEWHGWRGQTNQGNQASDVPYEVRIVDTPTGEGGGSSGVHERYNLGNENYPGAPSNFVDNNGDTWLADPGPISGTSFDNFSSFVPIAGTLDDLLYQTERYGSDFTYSFPVVNGEYTVRLHFAELWWGAGGGGGGVGGIGSRICDIYVNGVLRLSNYDIYAEVGNLTATYKDFITTVTTSAITVRIVFNPASLDDTYAKISAIEFFQSSTITGFGTINQNANFGQWNPVESYLVNPSDIGKYLEFAVFTDGASDIVMSCAAKFEFTAQESQPVTRESNQLAGLVMEPETSTHDQYPRVMAGFLGNGAQLRGTNSGLYQCQGGSKDICAQHARYVFGHAYTWGPLIAGLKAKYPDRVFMGTNAAWLPTTGPAGGIPPQDDGSTNWWYEYLFGTFSGYGATHEQFYLHSAGWTFTNPNTSQQYQYRHHNYVNRSIDSEQDLPDGRVSAPTAEDPIEPGENINGGQLAGREAVRWSLGIPLGFISEWDGIHNDWFYPVLPSFQVTDWDNNNVADVNEGVTESQINDWWKETLASYTSEIRSYFLRKTGRQGMVGINPGNPTWVPPADFQAANLSQVNIEGFHWMGPWFLVAQAMDTWKISTFGGYNPIGATFVEMATSFGSAEWNFIPLQTTQHTNQANLPVGGYGLQDPNRKINLVNLRDAFARGCRYGLTMACCFGAIYSYTYLEHRFDWFYDEYHTDLGAPLATAVRLGKGPRPTNPEPLPDLGPTAQPNFSIHATNMYGAIFVRFFERGVVVHYVPRNDWATSIVVTKADLQQAATLAGLTWGVDVAPDGDVYYFQGTQARHQTWVDDGMNIADDPDGTGYGCILTGTWTNVGSSAFWNSTVNVAMLGNRAYVTAAGSGAKKVRWQFTVPVDDDYDVFVNMPHIGYGPDMYDPDNNTNPNVPIGYVNQIFNFAAAGLTGPFGSNVRYTITFDNGAGGFASTQVRINQALNLRGHLLGRFKFRSGVTYNVEVDDGGSPGGPIMADALFLQSTSTLFNRGTVFVKQRMFGGVGSEGNIEPSGSTYKRTIGDGLILKYTPKFVATAGSVAGNFAAHDTNPGNLEASYVGAGWVKNAVFSHQFVSFSPFQEDIPAIVNDNPYYSHVVHNAELYGGVDAYGCMLGPRDNTRATYAAYRWAIRASGVYRLYEWHGWVGKDPGAESASVPWTILSNGTPILSGTINQTTNFGQWNFVQEASLVKGAVIELRIYSDITDASWIVSDACKLQLISAT